MSRASRSALAVACVAAVSLVAIPGASGHGTTHRTTGAVDAAAPTSTSAVGLGVCDMSVALVREPAGRLRPLLPARYSIGKSLYGLGLPLFGHLVFWVMECDRIEVPSGPPRRAIVAMVGIQIESPERPTSIATIANMFDLYTLSVQTDDADVAEWLRAGGMPTEVVAGMRMDRGRRVTIDAPSASSPYALGLRPLHPDPVGVHRHANTFWHDDGIGRTSRLELQIPRAEDVTCLLPLLCGAVKAPPGSPVASLLRSSRRPVDFVFDHVGLSASSLALTSE